MSELAQLLEQRDELTRRIEELRAAERNQAVHKIRELMRMHGMEAEDIVSVARVRTTRNPGMPKYRDPVSGATWSGKGRAPAWIKDKNRNEFLI